MSFPEQYTYIQTANTRTLIPANLKRRFLNVPCEILMEDHHNFIDVFQPLSVGLA